MKKTFILIIIALIVAVVWTSMIKHPADGYAAFSRDGIAFVYPTKYFLEEKDGSIVLTLDTEENRLVREGKSPGREGPTSMTVSISPNGPGVGMAGTPGSSTKKPVMVGGKEGSSYEWSGLYEGRSVEIPLGERLYTLSVTHLTYEDPILADFDRLLGTVRFLVQ